MICLIQSGFFKMGAQCILRQSLIFLRVFKMIKEAVFRPSSPEVSTRNQQALRLARLVF